MLRTQLLILPLICLLFTPAAISAPGQDKQTNHPATPQKAEDSPLSQTNQLIALSKQKWQWMADKNVSRLSALFHTEAKFVHMSGTWNTARELEIIESGSIWYKNTVVHDTDVEITGNTAVVWSRITLEAHVRGNDVANEFTATEVYVKSAGNWALLALTFSSVRDSHTIEH
ncbi:nuclear transport factor 2 family protein [Salinimonas sediminis]|uniref:Nuclear transport factor 2 family protein n=1 Tax=Salinimonas sediminis TaxID=2303538 RepID=A0A346NKK5_9ALTE|nr:nuclear transport factor 2 family protein [Salinimonas sediminis]AXR06062.1 nuclear transport factor 2 family protein [Salinimonas sediminis]